MNERYTEALEQYDVEVRAVRKGRGAWICETDQGLMLLKEYRGTLKRLEFEDEVLESLDTRTSLRADQYVRNREGSLLTAAGDGVRYIVKRWFSDRECDIRDGYEIRKTLSRLAMLHSQLRGIPWKEEWNLGSILAAPPEDEMARHNREMRRVRTYIRGRQGKTEFELHVIGSYDLFYSQALEAEKGLRGLWEGEKSKPLYLCHGDLDQHHVLMGADYTAVIEYNRMHIGIQALDLYRFMRKVMEKHGWNQDLGLSMLDAYQKVLPMESRERACLYYLFLYPEKYWKQLNFYYNTNKAWIPAKSTEKISDLVQQEKARGRFLERLRTSCGS